MRRGTGVSGGVGRAPALRYLAGERAAPQAPAADRAAETAAFRAAVDAARAENDGLCRQALERAGEAAAEIFAAHNMILEDEESLCLPALDLIRDEGRNAAAATEAILDEIIAMMESVEDQHLAARAADFRDVKDQLLRHLLGGGGPDLSRLEGSVVLVAGDLSPSDTIRLDLAHVAGIVCQEGGRTSHTAILAKAMGIPAVVGCAGILDEVRDGDLVLLDGERGEVLCRPTPAEEAEYARRAAAHAAARDALDHYRGLSSATLDGRIVEICANIASPGECAAAMAQDCEGVGLFRSEFLYMERPALPTEEEQYRAYRETLERAAGRTVTIRTLDAGGDKKLPILTQAEENPFLGYRAIRICLDQPALFKTQLRALYRASAHGKMRILFPMISSLDELRGAEALAAEVRAALAAEGVPFDPDVLLGIMVEIPAVAVLADAFAAECDFFSIGTNDLTQYTLAADRGNRKVEGLYTHYHPAVLRLIAHTIRCARQGGIPCCMCGEAAGDPLLIPVLLGLGLDEFSMSAPGILHARRIIRGSSFEVCRALAARALACSTAAEVKALLG